MPKITVNGNEMDVKEGSTVIEAFKQSEQDIAHYCWHPGLSIAGVCRLCMIEVEGNPKLQIACNTVVTEGMKVSNQSEKVKDTVRWGMDFHLINHPLDCPICDQAGECGLQEQYMKYGQYDSSMSQPKVKKSKVVDLGEKIVLDSERCILCSRCVRFTDEVTKTNELGIFNRGDHSEIGTFGDKKLENDYALNTVDICPVGALTSKDFRFQQRVWYLKDVETTCPGCSTGCSVKVYYNNEGLFRVKPVEDHDVNGYWMCDEGRPLYKFANSKSRIKTYIKIQNSTPLPLKLNDVETELANVFGSDDKVAVILTGQNTNEEYSTFKNFLNTKNSAPEIYYWQNNKDSFDSFDGLLKRGDKNPNTKGLVNTFTNMKPLADLAKSSVKTVVVFAPENIFAYPDYGQVVQDLTAQGVRVIFVGSQMTTELYQLPDNSILIPAKTFFEKNGTFTNFKGQDRKVKKGQLLVRGAIDMTEFVEMCEKSFEPDAVQKTRKFNEMAKERRVL
jgi:NADH-quinone oxidoreductase subunit G